MVAIFHIRVFTDRNLTSFDFVRRKLGHDELKENHSRGKVYTHAYIYIYTYIRITAGTEVNLQVITINRELQRG